MTQWVYNSAQAVIIKYHKPCGLNNINLLSNSSGSEVQDQGASKIGLVSGEVSQIVDRAFSICPHVVVWYLFLSL